MRVKEVEPAYLTVFNGALFFMVNDGTSAIELWRSDGSTAGTVLIKRIFPSGSSATTLAASDLTLAGNTLFFAASDGASGPQLWKSDGTAADTVLVKNIAPGNTTSSLSNLAPLGTRLLFTSNGGGLWASDGTSAGTVLLKDAGNIAQNSSFIPFNSGAGDGSAQIGDVLYFPAFTDVNQTELWRSDGTAAGTFMVKDINPGGGAGGGSWPRHLTAIGNTLFFTTFDINDSLCAASFNQQQSGLWKSDGTAAGTVRLSSGPGDCKNSAQYHVMPVGGTLYYTDNAALYKSDGTPQGTVLVRQQFENINQLAGGPIANLLGAAIFNVYDTATQALSLWRSDGTQAGTTLIQTFNTQPVSSAPDEFILLGNTLLFTADDGVNGDELWSAPVADLLRVSAPVTPAGGGQLRSLDGRVQLSFPAGATSSALTVSIAPLAQPSQPLGERQGRYSFTLEARDAGGGLVTQFSKPYVLTVSYSDAEVSGLFEPEINLAYWNGSAWVYLLPCIECSLDTTNNRITVQLNHFTEFAVLGAAERRVYLPLTRR
jgi:ELWxxDGT repeat protein